METEKVSIVTEAEHRVLTVKMVSKAVAWAVVTVDPAPVADRLFRR